MSDATVIEFAHVRAVAQAAAKRSRGVERPHRRHSGERGLMRPHALTRYLLRRSVLAAAALTAIAVILNSLRP